MKNVRNGIDRIIKGIIKVIIGFNKNCYQVILVQNSEEDLKPKIKDDEKRDFCAGSSSN